MSKSDDPKLSADQLIGVLHCLHFGLSNAAWEGTTDRPWAGLTINERKQVLARAKAKAKKDVAALVESNVSPELNRQFLARFDWEKVSLAEEAEPARLRQQQEDFARRPNVSGLRMAMNDLLSNVTHFSLEQRRSVNHRLKAQNLPLLPALSGKLRKVQDRILKRGKIRTESEYYLAKEIVCGPGDDFSKSELTLLAQLVDTFESGRH